MARVELIVGPMFSGKTTELLKRVHRFRALEVPTLVLTSALDTRAGGLSTHAPHALGVPCEKVFRLSDVLHRASFVEARVIAVDEAQFFEDLVGFVRICERENKHVIIAGLDGDYKREPFGDVLLCVPLCDTIDKLTALELRPDGTTRPAIFTHRRDDLNESVIDVGGENKYVAVSRESYLRLCAKSSG